MNPLVVIASIGYLGAVLAWGFAAYLFVVAPGSRSSRILIALLLVDGVAIATGGAMGALLQQRFGVDRALLGALHQASDWALVTIYLPFIGTALTSKLVRPLKGRATQNAIFAVGALVTLAILLSPRPVVAPLIAPFYLVISGALTWGLVGAIDNWISARAPAIRAQAKAFALAFGVRDVLWALVFLFAALSSRGILTSADFPVLGLFRVLAYPAAVVLYVPLVVYGVLRTELFDIDLRIKKTLRRSLVAAAFVTAFFLVSELASLWLSDRFGTVIGLLGTGALVLFLDPACCEQGHRRQPCRKRLRRRSTKPIGSCRSTARPSRRRSRAAKSRRGNDVCSTR